MNRRAWLAIVWIAPSAVFLALVHLVMAHYRIETPPPLSEDARAAILARLRAALDGGAAAPLPDLPGLSRAMPGRGPLAVEVWVDGTRRGRVDSYEDSVARATEAAAGALLQQPDIAALTAEQRTRARIKVDVTVGRGELEQRFPLLDLVSMHPGVDGLGVTVGSDQQVLLPDELIALGAMSKHRPFAVVPDFALGLDTDKTDELFGRRLGLTGTSKAVVAAFAAKDPTYQRVRTESFIEPASHDGPPVPLTRGVPPGPEPTAANLRAAALAGAHYLVNHLGADGRYVYEVELPTGNVKSGYSIPRHAGVTYFLAQMFRITHEDFLREPIERAFALLGKLIDAGGCAGTLPDGDAFACVLDRGETIADLGSSALAVVALVEYQRATGETTYLDTATKLSAWILMMQRPDGSFRHRYDVPGAKPDDQTQLLYYSGEATLALARMYEVTKDERYLRAAERGLDWLVSWYDFFAGGYLYGEEHWTCISAEALWPALQKSKYLDFCQGYGAFLRGEQMQPGDFPSQEDLAGSYSVTPFLMPSNTPAGSRTEAMISTYLLTRDHGQEDATLRAQILGTLRYLLRQQIRPDGMFDVAAKADGEGGVPDSPSDPSVRIDYVQHVCSAMIRASELVE